MTGEEKNEFKDDHDATGNSSTSAQTKKDFTEKNALAGSNILPEGLNIEEINDKHDLEMKTKKTFRRYGLLANRSKVATMTSSSSDSESSSESSSPESESSMESPFKVGSQIELKSDSKGDTGSEIPTSPSIGKSRSLVEQMDIANSSMGVLDDKQDRSKQTRVSEESISKMSLMDRMSLIPSPEKCLNRRRLSHSDIQFRPSNPSFYGCQRNPTGPVNPLGPFPRFQSSYTSANQLETVVILDKPSTSDTFNKVVKEPIVIENEDCPIEILSVESLNGNELGAHRYIVTQNSSTLSSPRAREIDLANQRYSPVTDSSSDEDVTILDDDTPPCLMRNSPPLRQTRERSPRNSPPSLQPVMPSFPPTTGEYSTCRDEPSSANRLGNKTPVLNRPDPRKLKMERFYRRQKSKKEMEDLKKAYLREKQLFIKRKSEEKRLRIKYLELKVKSKELTMIKVKNKLRQL